MRHLIAFLMLLYMLPATAGELPGPVISTADQRLKACSSGVIEVWGFIDVGKASVWMPDCGKLAWPLEPPVLLRFGYNRKVPGDAFAKSARAMLERNIEESAFRALSDRIERFNANYRDTAKGDTYSMLYESDGTLTLWLNDTRLGHEQGHAFARQYLKIWFGPKPYSAKLKEALLTPAS